MARRSFDPSWEYRSVVSQQGHVSVEPDANEAEDIDTVAGVRKANEMLAHGKTDAAALAKLLVQFPAEKDKILAAIHAHPAGGNALVARVIDPSR